MTAMVPTLLTVGHQGCLVVTSNHSTSGASPASTTWLCADHVDPDGEAPGDRLGYPGQHGGTWTAEQRDAVMETATRGDMVDLGLATVITDLSSARADQHDAAYLRALDDHALREQGINRSVQARDAAAALLRAQDERHARRNHLDSFYLVDALERLGRATTPDPRDVDTVARAYAQGRIVVDPITPVAP